ncbi:fimbrial protein [Klebsiella aerogenes]|uniref:fimbrial protein n=1 Tax=Klebsiella aerogenes TaxID=548 RepID=UPI00351D8ACE
MLSLRMLLIFAGWLPFVVWAGNTAQINLSGTLVEPPPCTINSGIAISVPFGDNVGTSRVNGVNYTKPINYSIVCDQDPYNNPWVMGLTVKGTSTSFDTAAVQANIDGSSSSDLGIKILLNGSAMNLNTRVAITEGASPTLEAVPVQNAGATLPEGHFHATATLLADYE